MEIRSNDAPIQYEEEIRDISHDDFKKYVLKLSREIEKYTIENNLRIDYVVPILRSGAVPAVYIANELNLIKFAPIQVKKIKENGIYDHIILLNDLKDLDKEKELNLLVVEGTYSSGETANTALNEIRKSLPKAKILFSCVCVRGEENLPKDVEKSFYGFSLAREKLFVYPWEIKEQKETHPDQKLENIFY
ncbi:MAG: phosphoribosyltransferase [Clostridiales bacterium]|nr:phosphoribosyltransferase [Clostridiales bacterium]